MVGTVLEHPFPQTPWVQELMADGVPIFCVKDDVWRRLDSLPNGYQLGNHEIEEQNVLKSFEGLAHVLTVRVHVAANTRHPLDWMIMPRRDESEPPIEDVVFRIINDGMDDHINLLRSLKQVFGNRIMDNAPETGSLMVCLVLHLTVDRIVLTGQSYLQQLSNSLPLAHDNSKRTPPSLEHPLTTDLPVPINKWHFLTVIGPTRDSFILTEWFTRFRPQHLIGIRPPAENKPVILSFKSEYWMNQVWNILNSDVSQVYDIYEYMQESPTISLSTFRYAILPTYIAEAYAHHHSVFELEEMLKCAPPVTELHLIDMSVPGSGELRRNWKYEFLEQQKYPPLPAPHPSLNPPPHRLCLCKLDVVEFSPVWLHKALETHLVSMPHSIHWYRLALMMRGHVASFPGHVARKFVVPLCRTSGPYDTIIRTIALWAVEEYGFKVGIVQRDHERFGFIDGMWRLELETKLPLPRYYIQPGMSLDSLL
ncbi:hypothetical protein BS47DRAFT_1390711 [Hydnum rufescens UP504]|uniref:Uncharacterized protein n=1 Tax=Hydnum rufescens UP504 TaxID=1448309 RepID=A0A9P6B2J8_9AGAM|nr:hypothetical protein BS47DRAFT_1390711 [Hydnum rufescens UP504]